MASLVSKPPKGLVFLVSDSKAGTRSVWFTPSVPRTALKPLYPPFPVSLRSLLLPKSSSPLPARLVCFQWALPLASLWLSAHGGSELCPPALPFSSPQKRGNASSSLSLRCACPAVLAGTQRTETHSELPACLLFSHKLKTERQKEQPCVSFLCRFGGQEPLLRFEERLSNYQLCFTSVHYFFDFL